MHGFQNIIYTQGSYNYQFEVAGPIFCSQMVLANES